MTNPSPVLAAVTDLLLAIEEGESDELVQEKVEKLSLLLVSFLIFLLFLYYYCKMFCFVHLMSIIFLFFCFSV